MEAVFLLQTSYFTYDRPTTNLDSAAVLPEPQRSAAVTALQLDTNVKQELLKDLFVALTLYNSYDNRPPNATADRNDVGIVASIGWTY